MRERGGREKETEMFISAALSEENARLYTERKRDTYVRMERQRETEKIIYRYIYIRM